VKQARLSQQLAMKRCWKEVLRVMVVVAVRAVVAVVVVVAVALLVEHQPPNSRLVGLPLGCLHRQRDGTHHRRRGRAHSRGSHKRRATRLCNSWLQQPTEGHARYTYVMQCAPPSPHFLLAAIRRRETLMHRWPCALMCAVLLISLHINGSAMAL
jgi:hypothetical protein